MNIEELREKFAEMLFRVRYPQGCWDYRKNSDTYYRSEADKLLKACKEAGLAFVVKDAEGPDDFSHAGYEDRRVVRRELGKQGYRKIKEIKL